MDSSDQQRSDCTIAPVMRTRARFGERPARTSPIEPGSILIQGSLSSCWVEPNAAGGEGPIGLARRWDLRIRLR